MKKLKLVDIKTVKFILVGIINTAVGTGTMFLLYNLCGASYWVASAANYIVGSVVSYFLNKYYTFQSKENSFMAVAKFVINISVCYFIAYGLAKPATSFVLSSASDSIKDNVAMLIGMGAFIIINYIGQRFWVFAEKNNSK